MNVTVMHSDVVTHCEAAHKNLNHKVQLFRNKLLFSEQIEPGSLFLIIIRPYVMQSQLNYSFKI